MSVRVYDAPGDQSISIARGGKLDIDTGSGANSFEFEGLRRSDVFVYKSGSEGRVRWLLTGETVLSVPISTTSQKFVFSDGTYDLRLIDNVYKIGESVISDDSVAPILQAPTFSGNKLYLRFDEELSSAAVPLASAFSVQANNTAVTGFSVLSVEGSILTLELAQPLQASDAVRVSYAQPTSRSQILQDISGNRVVSFSGASIVSATVDTVAPILLNAATVEDGSAVVLYFSEPLSTTTAATGAFQFTAGGVQVPVLALSVSGSILQLSLGASLTAGQALSVRYTDPTPNNDSAAIQDSAGNDVSSFDYLVANNVAPDTALSSSVTNILKPNFFGTATSLSPSWKVSSGMVARVYDAPGGQSISIAKGGKLDVDTGSGTNTVTLDGLSLSDVLVYRSGSEGRVRWLQTGETILSLPILSDTQKLVFKDGEFELRLQDGAYKLGSSVVPTDDISPSLQLASVSGTRLVLSFSEELSGAAVPLASAVTITVNGSAVTGYSMTGVETNKLIVSLSDPVPETATVSVAYAQPTVRTQILQDISGNRVASFSSTPVELVKADSAPPTVLSFTPADNSTGIAVDSNLIINFSEPVQLGTTGAVKIIQSATGAVAETLLVGSTGPGLAVVGGRLTIDPVKDLLPGTAYHLQIDAGVIKDAAGNSYQGISEASTFNFTTTGLVISSAGVLAPGNRTVLGLATPGSTIDVAVTGTGGTSTSVGPATADSLGKWSFAVPTSVGTGPSGSLAELKFTAGQFSVTKTFVVTANSWTADVIKTEEIRSALDTALVDGKVVHAEAVQIIDSATPMQNAAPARRHCGARPLPDGSGLAP